MSDVDVIEKARSSVLLGAESVGDLSVISGIVANASSGESMQEKIKALESVIIASGNRVGEMKLFHHFIPNVYVRELHIPKGWALTGQTHKFEHFILLLTGSMRVWTEGGMVDLFPGQIVKGMPGIKRVGYAYEDTIGINILHNPSNETDPLELERIFTVSEV